MRPGKIRKTTIDELMESVFRCSRCSSRIFSNQVQRPDHTERSFPGVRPCSSFLKRWRDPSSENREAIRKALLRMECITKSLLPCGISCLKTSFNCDPHPINNGTACPAAGKANQCGQPDDDLCHRRHHRDVFRFVSGLPSHLMRRETRGPRQKRRTSPSETAFSSFILQGEGATNAYRAESCRIISRFTGTAVG